MALTRVALLVSVATLALACVDGGGAYSTDTPGCATTGVQIAVCPERGLYQESVEVQIVAPGGITQIYYTLDGSLPTLETGTAYSGPITIAGTPERGVMILRAASFVNGFVATPTVTHSFVFPQHVIRQPANPEGFPAKWGGDGITRDADYGMDPNVLVDTVAAHDGLRALPTLTLVIDARDVFGPESGIYMFPQQDRTTRERPAFAELIFPDGSDGFAVQSGVRIQGATSTYQWQSAKLSFRLAFKSKYGNPKLNFRVFPDSDVTAFDTLILDAHHSDTWIHRHESQRRRAQYIRDTYTSDLQRAVGGLAPHSRFVHLYLNGLYWGVYDVHERPDDAFASAYMGGTKNEYDVLRHGEGNSPTLVAGDRRAWDTMIDIANGGLADPSSYRAVQRYLDVDDFIAYMLVNFYAGNEDWPNNNWYTARRRIKDARFRFFSWDAEYVLRGKHDRTGVEGPEGPGMLYQALLASTDFRAALLARGTVLLGNDGILGPENVTNLYRRRLAEIDTAIILESARWGDNRRTDAPYTRKEWLTERNWLLKHFFPTRSQRVLSQLNARTSH